jgi:methylthioribulose-1-phosphate dehydratase
MSDDKLEAVGAELAKEAATLASFGWMRATSGNLSAVLERDPLRLAVTASGLDKGELTAADYVVVDQSGAALPGQAGRPSAEAALHARVAAISGAGAVVHVHPPLAVVAASRWPGGIDLENLEMLKALGIAAESRVILPVIENSQDMAVLGNRLAAAFEPALPAVVVAGHGLYAWGAHLRQARHHVEAVESLLQIRLGLAMLLGGAERRPS